MVKGCNGCLRTISRTLRLPFRIFQLCTQKLYRKWQSSQRRSNTVYSEVPHQSPTMMNDNEDDSSNAMTVAFVDTSNNHRKVKRKNAVDDFAASPRNEYHPMNAFPSSTSSFFSSSPFQFPIGGRVVIQDLARQTELNHHLGVVEEYLEQEVRFKIRPLGRRGRRATRAKFVSIRPMNLRLAPPSAFVARIKSYRGTTVTLPLTCRVELDNENRLAVRLMYSDFLGTARSAIQEIEGDEQYPEYNNTASSSSSAEETAFGVVTTSIVDEDLRGQSLGGDEVLILYDKPAIRDLYDAMVDYELVQELEMTVEAGLHGSFPLCRLCFPYQVEQS
jgi:hypothetical protein